MGIVQPLYVNESEAAKLLRHDVTWLRTNSTALERTAGFPKIDPVIGMRHREAIEEWARERNITRLQRVSGQPKTGNKNAF
jgi:hypothetical protein